MITNGKRRITLREVAKRAGLSMAAASQALIENPNSTISVSEATRERMMKLAAEMGYRHNRAAQVLRQGISGLIGIVESRGVDFGIAEQRSHATVDLSMDTLCADAVTTLIRLIDGDSAIQPTLRWVAGKLIVRQSSIRSKLQPPAITLQPEEIFV